MQVNNNVPPCAIVMVISVVLSVGLTPVQFGFGQPASAPLTVFGAVRTAGLVVGDQREMGIAGWHRGVERTLGLAEPARVAMRS